MGEGAKTATVIALTAEVRVLMVGSRQVTLSVAKQLDEVDLKDCEPFGRVRITAADHQVIGRDRETGALVTAGYLPMNRLLKISRDDLHGKIRVCSHDLRRAERNSRYLRLRWKDRFIFVHVEAAQGCVEHAMPVGECGTWSANGCDEEIDKWVAFQEATNALHRAARELPLIVLAGLR